MTYPPKVRKMKKLIGFIILFLISLVLTGCGDEGDSGEAKKFVDPNGRYSVIYPGDWYSFETTVVPGEKTTTWHTNGTSEVTLGITDWEPNGPLITKTVLEWAQENRDRLIAEGYDLIRDISPIMNANGNIGYEFTIRDKIILEDIRIAFFLNNLNEQFDLTFYYATGYPDASLTQIIQNFKTTDL